MRPDQNASILWLAPLLIHVLCGQAQAQDRLIGADAPGGGACLVKRFTVPAAATVTGIEFVSNDPTTVFPRVALLRGPVARLSDATVVQAFQEVRSISDHRIHLDVPPVGFESPQEVYVVVELPAGEGARRAGSGAGLAARQIDRPGDSYFAMSRDGHLGRMDVEYAIDLLIAGGSGAGKADPGASGETGSDVPRVAGASVHPNPFNPSVAIELQVPRTAFVRIDIHDVAGRLVRIAFQGELAAGRHRHDWDGRDDRGRRLASGIYLAKIQIGDVRVNRKLVLAQ